MYNKKNRLKTENWKYCSKVIFKCVNNAVEPNFEVVFAKKSTCRSCEQYTNPPFFNKMLERTENVHSKRILSDVKCEL